MTRTNETNGPGPMWTFLKSMNSWQGLKSGIDIGLQTLGWVRG